MMNCIGKRNLSFEFAELVLALLVCPAFAKGSRPLSSSIALVPSNLV